MDRMSALMALIMEYPKEHPVRLAIMTAIAVGLVYGYFQF